MTCVLPKTRDPYPSKPTPMTVGMGCHGYGCGLPKKTPGLPVTFPNNVQHDHRFRPTQLHLQFRTGRRYVRIQLPSEDRPKLGFHVHYSRAEAQRDGEGCERRRNQYSWVYLVLE